MRKVIEKVLITLIVMVSGISIVSAQEVYYTNANGIEMNELQYNKMRTLFSEKKVEYLSQEEFDQYKDITILNSDVMYEKVTYGDGKVIDREIVSEEEYDNSPETKVCTDEAIMPYSDTSQYIETAYKRISASLYSNNGISVISSLNWKQVPLYKSYDVYAMRFQFFNFSGAVGKQDYYVNGNYGGSFNYNSSSEGYKGFSDGFGISMNLKDGSNISSYDLALSVNLSLTQSNVIASAWVTYQHATANVTRAQSMSYNLNGAGLGGVLDYTSGVISNTYDGMGGLHLLKRP